MRTIGWLTFVLVLAVAGHSLAATSCKKNPDCQDGNPCTVDRCDHSTKTCRNTPAADGTTCNDQNACTRTDTCKAGACVGANPVVCTASDQCHGVGTCDPVAGSCSNPAAPDGTSCNDYDACTQTDVCESGQCAGGNPVACAAIDACHLVGTCEKTTGICSNPPVDPAVCPAVGPCNVPNLCDGMTYACSIANKTDGTACNDGDACTQTDQCSAGSCTGGNPVVCGAADDCTVAGTCDSLTGTCTGGTAPDGTVCDAGTSTSCSEPDVCAAGTCSPGGGGDTDGDGVCDADDDCPNVADPDQDDLDGDGIGDACDAADASMNVARLLVHVSTPTTASNGHVIFRGTFPASAPVDATQGIAIHIEDAGSLVIDDAFAATECKTNHAASRCKRRGAPSTQAKLRSKRGTVRFIVRLADVAVASVPTAPVAVTLTANGVDRTGTLGSCKTKPGTARCVAH